MCFKLSKRCRAHKAIPRGLPGLKEERSIPILNSEYGGRVGSVYTVKLYCVCAVHTVVHIIYNSMSWDTVLLLSWTGQIPFLLLILCLNCPAHSKTDSVIVSVHSVPCSCGTFRIIRNRFPAAASDYFEIRSAWGTTGIDLGGRRIWSLPIIAPIPCIPC